MFGDIGWAELLIIGVVALIVIGPEDLPEMFRQLGRFTAKIRSMAREFQRAMDQAAKESGVNDVAKDLKTMTSPKSLGLNAVKEAADKFEKWDPLKPATKPAAARPAAVKPAEAAPAAPVPPAEMGPATKALAEKQAQRKAILRDTAAKLKAVDVAPADAPPETPPPAAAKKPRAVKAAPAAPAPARAPRRKKADGA